MRSSVIALAVAALVSACAQTEGEHCGSNYGECESGLVCGTLEGGRVEIAPVDPDSFYCRTRCAQDSTCGGDSCCRTVGTVGYVSTADVCIPNCNL